jgi:hypothetical protein
MLSGDGLAVLEEFLVSEVVARAKVVVEVALVAG